MRFGLILALVASVASVGLAAPVAADVAVRARNAILQAARSSPQVSI